MSGIVYEVLPLSTGRAVVQCSGCLAARVHSLDVIDIDDVPFWIESHRLLAHSSVTV